MKKTNKVRKPNPDIIDRLEMQIGELFNDAHDAQMMGETLEKILDEYQRTGIMTKQMEEAIKYPFVGY